MGKYNKLSKRDIDVINNSMLTRPSKEKALDVLNYLKFHIEKHNGELCKSLEKTHKAYKKHNLKFSLSTFKVTITRLKLLGLIQIELRKNVNLYTIPKY